MDTTLVSKDTAWVPIDADWTSKDMACALIDALVEKTHFKAGYHSG